MQQKENIRTHIPQTRSAKCIILYLLIALMFVSCTSRISTVTSYNPCMYQNAEASEPLQAKFQSHSELALSFRTEAEYYDNHELEQPKISETVEAEAIIFGGTLNLGITKRLGLIVDVSTTPQRFRKMPMPSVAMKYQLGPQGKPFSLALMYGLGLSTDESDEQAFDRSWMDMKARLETTDIHLLTSYRLDNDNVITLAPFVATFRNKVDISKSYVETVETHLNSNNVYRGIRLGFQAEEVKGELALMMIEDEKKISLGFAVEF